MRDVVLFDLDGTLALIDHRRHLVEFRDCPQCHGCGEAPGVPECEDCNGTGRLKPDWPAFFRACVDDEPNWPVIEVLQALRRCLYRIHIVSARSDEVRAETEAWLNTFVSAGWDDLTMRPAGDSTPDDELKRRWLTDGTIPRDRVLCAYDDRDKVVAMWRSEGVPCFQVAPGAF